MNAQFAINDQEIYNINIEKYEKEFVINKMKNPKSSCKYNMLQDEIEAVKNDKTLMIRKKDSRYSFKNRRSINKYWKDFNNNQM